MKAIKEEREAKYKTKSYEDLREQGERRDTTFKELPGPTPETLTR